MAVVWLTRRTPGETKKMLDKRRSAKKKAKGWGFGALVLKGVGAGLGLIAGGPIGAKVGASAAGLAAGLAEGESARQSQKARNIESAVSTPPNPVGTTSY